MSWIRFGFEARGKFWDSCMLPNVAATLTRCAADSATIAGLPQVLVGLFHHGEINDSHTLHLNSKKVMRSCSSRLESNTF
jgi:hypothetical protein